MVSGVWETREGVERGEGEREGGREREVFGTCTWILHVCSGGNLYLYVCSEILAADKQLAEEIEFDLKRVEEEQKKASRAVHTPLAATPHAQMVGRSRSLAS